MPTYRDSVTATRHYTSMGLFTAEVWSGGPLDGWAVTNPYDSCLRRATLQVRQGGTLRIQHDYAYNTAGRLDRVWQGSYAAYYAYEPLSPLVDTVEYRYQTSTVRLTADRAYDHLNRLTDMVNTPQTGSVVTHGYTYNAASQRTNATLADGSLWNYDYDPLGQVTNGWQYTAGGQPLSGRQYAYAFDDIGNRDQTVINGGTTDYTANLLNQYTAVGAASPTHDADGNLTADGTWTYTWDGENRLTVIEKSTQRLEFTYDWQGRRVQKKVFSGSTGNWSLTLERRFVYDGWNLLAIMDSNAALNQQFMWGTDLSGTAQGAGGVSGLVKIYDHNLNQHYFPGYDGNGNIMLLVDGDTGAAAARYEYGPFGEVLSATGTYATANPCRFSTKFTDDETGLLYYDYRYYIPSWGRWLSRDPIEEQGGVNLYGFIGNNPIGFIDPDGQLSLESIINGVVGTHSLTLPLGPTTLTGSLSWQKQRGACCFDVTVNLELSWNPQKLVTSSLRYFGGRVGGRIADVLPLIEVGGGAEGTFVYCPPSTFKGNPNIRIYAFGQASVGNGGSHNRWKPRPPYEDWGLNPPEMNGFWGGVRIEISGNLNVRTWTVTYDGTYLSLSAGYRYKQYTWEKNFRWQIDP